MTYEQYEVPFQPYYFCLANITLLNKTFNQIACKEFYRNGYLHIAVTAMVTVTFEHVL